MRFKLDASPLASIAEGLRGNAKRAGLAAIAADHQALIIESFAKGGVDPVTGSPGAWPRKKIPTDTTGRSRRNSDPMSRLTDTGQLKGSISFTLLDNGYEIGPADLPYAAIHQFGGEIGISEGMRHVLRGMGFRPRKSTATIRIPARPYLVLPEPWLEQLKETFLDTVLAVGGEQ